MSALDAGLEPACFPPVGTSVRVQCFKPLSLPLLYVYMYIYIYILYIDVYIFHLRTYVCRMNADLAKRNGTGCFK